MLKSFVTNGKQDLGRKEPKGNARKEDLLLLSIQELFDSKMFLP